MLVSNVQQHDSVTLFQILFHFRLWQDTESSSLCCTGGPGCWLFYTEECVYVNPKLLIYLSSSLFGNHKFLFSVCPVYSCFANKFIQGHGEWLSSVWTAKRGWMKPVHRQDGPQPVGRCLQPSTKRASPPSQRPHTDHTDPKPDCPGLRTLSPGKLRAFFFLHQKIGGQFPLWHRGNKPD